MIPSWMVRLVSRFLGRHDDASVTFVPSSVHLWDNFVESSAVTTLMLAFTNGKKMYPVTQWFEQLVIAFRLCRDMDLDDKLDMNKVYPVLCRLITGTYFAEQGVMIPSDQEKFLLHAFLRNKLSGSCPICIFHWMIHSFPEQLVVAIDGQLPLAASCSSKRCGPDRMIALLFASPTAASVPDSQGRYPLHLACQNCCFAWETGIRQLFEAAPSVVLIPTAEGLSLFVSTALAQAEMTATLRHNRMEQSVHYTNTLFELLRNDPTAVRAGLVVEE